MIVKLLDLGSKSERQNPRHSYPLGITFVTEGRTVATVTLRGFKKDVRERIVLETHWYVRNRQQDPQQRRTYVWLQTLSPWPESLRFQDVEHSISSSTGLSKCYWVLCYTAVSFFSPVPHQYSAWSFGLCQVTPPSRITHSVFFLSHLHISILEPLP